MEAELTRFRVGLCTDQRLPWPVLLEQWRQLEAWGYDAAWVADHLMPWWIGEDHRAHRPLPWDAGEDDDDPYHEGWTCLAALAQSTRRLRCGVLVTNNLFRHPALVAKMAATVDHVSGGRLELGLGAGWFPRELGAYGMAFPAAGERVSRLGEALAVITRLLRDDRTTFEGTFYRLDRAPLAPKPVQGRVPIVIGAAGPRMLRLVARYADVWNADSPVTPAEVAERGAVLREACAAIGRDPAEIRWSLYGYPAVLGADPFASPQAFLDVVGPYREVGITEVAFEHPGPGHEAVLEAIARDVLPALRGGGS